MKRSIVAVAAAFAVVVAAHGQQSQSPPKPGEMPKLVENIDVRVINVDVVVTDKKGNPIKGLTKDDFDILENGTPKTISNFSEIESPIGKTVQPPGAQTTTPPVAAAATKLDIPEDQRRRVIFYIDNLSLAPFNRNRVFKSMKDFITNVMRPGDEAMIATFNRSMKVRVPFTRDPVQLQQTLDIIAGESAMGGSNKNDRRETEGRVKEATSYDEAVAIARSYAQSVEHDLRQSATSLSGLMETLAGIEGKKILVLTSEGFPMQPGREMFAYVDEVSREKDWGFGSSILEGMSFDSTNLIQAIAKTANANGITLYTIHAGGLGAVNENTAENSAPTSYQVSQISVTNSTDSLALMADVTGGLASLQTNNYAAAFNRIIRDLDSYYSLGYRAGTERVDRQRSIRVRVKNRNYIARARQSFVEKSTFAEMNDRVIANLLYRTKANDLNIVVKAERPRAADEDLYRVPVEIQIPMDSLTFLPQGEAHVGGFDVFIVVANKAGDMSDVARRSQQITIPSADFARAKGKYYTYSVELLMEKGVNTISVGVIDNISNVSGFAKSQVIARDLS